MNATPIWVLISLHEKKLHFKLIRDYILLRLMMLIISEFLPPDFSEIFVV